MTTAPAIQVKQLIFLLSDSGSFMLNRIWKIVVWPWSDISNAKNVTLSGAFLFFQAYNERVELLWLAIAGKRINNAQDIESYEINTIPKDLVIQKILPLMYSCKV